jgi:hypothetical protein
MGAADSKRRLCNCEAGQGRAGQGRAGQGNWRAAGMTRLLCQLLQRGSMCCACVKCMAHACIPVPPVALHDTAACAPVRRAPSNSDIGYALHGMHGCTCGTQLCRCTVRAACPMQQSMPQGASHNGRTAPLASDCLQVLVHSREHTPPLALVRFPQQLDDAHKVDREQRLQSSPHDGVARQGQRRRAGSLIHGSGGHGEERQGSYGGRVG